MRFTGAGARLEILPVPGIGDVVPGDDLAALIAAAAPCLRDGDVLVVTSKIVSKAEGRLVDVPVDGPQRLAAREEILAAETARAVARRGQTRIVQTHHGFVMASAGIDASNVNKSQLVLLPKDPDASARSLRASLRERHGVDVAVVISDTMGRPWRNGLTDVALGAAGIAAIRDHRGEIDPYGNPLSLTQMAVIDELAGAAELVKGKCDQVPVAVVRGYLTAAEADTADTDPDDTGDIGTADIDTGGERYRTEPAPVAGAAALVRDAEHDLFSLGTAEARAAGLIAAATLADATFDGPPADPAAVARAITAVADAVAPGTVFSHEHQTVRAPIAAGVPDWPGAATGMITCLPPASPGPATLIRFGADVHRLRVALAAENVASIVLSPPADSAPALVLAI